MSDELFDYLALKAMTVNTDTASPRVLGLDELPGNVPTDICPVRLLLPFGAGENEGTMIDYTSGNNAFINWKIIDIFLLRPVDAGEGIHTAADVLVAYARKYIKVCILNRFLDDAHVLEIKAVTAKPGIIEYPSSSGQYFHGCLCTLTIREAVVNPIAN